jgi:aspartate aminotransferase
MAGRIKAVRQQLHDALAARQPERDFSFVVKQIGMFSYTGLTPVQVDNMISKHHIYMTKDGRISLAGLNSAKVDYVAAAMDDSFRNY